MGVHTEGVKGATGKPPCRLRRGEISYNVCYYQQNLRLQSLVTEHAFVLKCVDYHTRRHNDDEKRCYRN